MPIFEYRCKSCRKEFEMLVRTGDTPACPGCAGVDLEKLLSLPAIKSETTHALAMRAGRRTARFNQSEKLREQAEYEAHHDD